MKINIKDNIYNLFYFIFYFFEILPDLNLNEDVKKMQYLCYRQRWNLECCRASTSLFDRFPLPETRTSPLANWRFSRRRFRRANDRAKPRQSDLFRSSPRAESGALCSVVPEAAGLLERGWALENVNFSMIKDDSRARCVVGDHIWPGDE